MSNKSFVPAAGSDWLLPLYDPFTKLLGMERAHRRLLDQAALQARDQVLEIGCGTGNLALLAKRLNPAAEIVGIDPDPRALGHARQKAHRSGLAVRFELAFSERLPFPGASFYRVLSALMFHHLPPATKVLALGEAFRVLKPGGSMHLADFDEGEHSSGGFHASICHSRHGSISTDIVVGLMRDAGFTDPQEVTRQSGILGRIAYYKAGRPPK